MLQHAERRGTRELAVRLEDLLLGGSFCCLSKVEIIEGLDSRFVALAKDFTFLLLLPTSMSAYLVNDEDQSFIATLIFGIFYLEGSVGMTCVAQRIGNEV